ncbi:MAG TPA: S1 RNA-binding domain-containing protein, partial [Anaerolineae bacterium]|nr:S1 RNA-binding domain-containing protein [Anaerolineae bacterium]
PPLIEPEETWTAPETLPANGRPHRPDENPLTVSNPWRAAQALHQADDSVQLTITGYNKGGLLVMWHNLQGFVPASQLVDFPQFHLESERMKALRQWHNQQITLKIIEIDPAQNRLIFSERAALVEASQRANLFNRIEPGQILEGVITNLTNFGAFVDLGGVEGLIHISELSWSRVTHPSAIVKPGQPVTVKVLNVNHRDERIALSLKRLKQNPWQTVNQQYKPGQLIEGVVSNVVSFGAFVQVEDELEGLIHISELAEGSFLHPRDVVRKGEKVTARVLYVDGGAKRLALSLRRVNQED